MTEFDYHNYQMKSIARNAKYRKCGSKSKKCSLPSDGMTQKQWKERNGAVIIANLNEPMDWATFKNLSKSSKEEYLNGLTRRYSVGLTAIAKMLGVSDSALRHVANNLNIDKRSKGGRIPDEAWKRWDEFCDQNKTELSNITDDVDEQAAADFETPVAEKGGLHGIMLTPLDYIGQDKNASLDAEKLGDTEKMKMNGFSLSFSGALDINAINNSLRQILGGTRKGVLNITFELA